MINKKNAFPQLYFKTGRKNNEHTNSTKFKYNFNLNIHILLSVVTKKN